MASGSPKKSRSTRADSFQLSNRRLREVVYESLRNGKNWGHILLSLVAALLMWGITQGWTPPFQYRIGYIPERDIVAAVSFEVEDEIGTVVQQRRAVAETLCIYNNDTYQLGKQQENLLLAVDELVAAESWETAPVEDWQKFLAGQKESTDVETTVIDPEILEKSKDDFERFCRLLTEESTREDLKDALDEVYRPWNEKGILETLDHSEEEGRLDSIQISGEYNATDVIVDVSDVRQSEIVRTLSVVLNRALERMNLEDTDTEFLSVMVENWIRDAGIPATLTIDKALSMKRRQNERESVAQQFRNYQPGQKLAGVGEPLQAAEITLLRKEYEARYNTQMLEISRLLGFGVASFGMFIAVFLLCGVYLAVYERKIVSDTASLIRLLVLSTIVVLLATATANDTWRAELIPLSMYAMILTIAFRRETALLVASALSIVVAVANGNSLPGFIIVFSAVAVSCLLMGRVRSRVRLITVGLGAGVITLATTLGVSTLAGQTFGSTGLEFWDQLLNRDASDVNYVTNLIQGAGWYGICVVLAGFFMTGLLPIIEWIFGVQTDISLLELGDPAHPLLQELKNRAPGTFTHSLNVGMLSEPAADAIGANGLLCRVGAYFHDIGKMFKPEYFAENQDENRHEQLLPSMSRLVIISHVKDGADLGRKHHLPSSFIDLIEQHHGTTLVEYFYHQAKTSEIDVEESDYRYPGPKPQSREAAVMMLADAVESASRTLDEPAPARVENLVNELAMKRLLDGEFDECGLTLSELRTIQQSLVKSLLALLHKRVDYPEESEVKKMTNLG
ncbi:MAG: metal-dependent phosphohydrolase [Planctomycetaceae bacterium]|nr:metal-dependent phosphohydrolase [Planctomycetaceae bacterium]|tara:strand:+ start:4476 stop:6857 length:2382 start_codon:yes stop_codon:yes gene_type:complete